MNRFFLLALYLFVLLLPLLLAAVEARPPRPLRDDLAAGAGMLAFAILLVEFVLSGRFRSVSRKIGMDVTMRFHQLMARTALVLVVIHPFLYTLPFNPQRPWDPTRQVTLSVEFSGILTGIAAWVLLPAFVLLSIGRAGLSYRYETWRWMHGIGAALIAALTLHHTLHVGRYSQDPALTGLWAALFAIAIGTLIYVYAIKPAMLLQRPWRVVSVRPLALKTWELALEPDGHEGLAFAAGQFVWLNIGNSAFSLRENPFSISSAPASGSRLEFVIKELGDFTRTIGRVAPGTRAYVDGPHGSLVVTGRQEPGIALFAGGVGIAPLIGILRQLAADNDSRPVLLVYGNRVVEQISYRQELQAWAQGANRTLVEVLSEPPAAWPGDTGFPDAAFVRRVFEPQTMRDWLFVLCGPAVMLESVEDTLIELGVPSGQILSERFDYD